MVQICGENLLEIHGQARPRMEAGRVDFLVSLPLSQGCDGGREIVSGCATGKVTKAYFRAFCL
jgi:hypothetical protein